MDSRDHELPGERSVLGHLAEEARDGQIIHLTRGGRVVAAVVSTDVAVAGSGALQALEDAATADAATS